MPFFGADKKLAWSVAVRAGQQRYLYRRNHWKGILEGVGVLNSLSDSFEAVTDAQ